MSTIESPCIPPKAVFTTRDAAIMEENSVNYSMCQYEVRLKKKKFLGFSERFVYLQSQKMIVCKVSYKRKFCAAR